MGVSVIYREQTENVEIGTEGITVAEIHKHFGGTHHVPPGATAEVNGKPAQPGDQLVNGDVLVFHDVAGHHAPPPAPEPAPAPARKPHAEHLPPPAKHGK
jgi:hypothetical protein